MKSYDTVVFMKCGDITLELFVDPNHPERVNSPEAKGLRHMAFTVDKIEDLDMEMEEIRMDWFGRRFTFVKDPDGLPIEIKEYARIFSMEFNKLLMEIFLFPPKQKIKLT